MEKHNPVPLTGTERTDLASITRHPGMTVLIEKIIGTHMRGQLEMVHNVQPDDPYRVTKIDGICAVANGMKLTYELAKAEVERNWRILQEQEEARKNAMEVTQ